MQQVWAKKLVTNKEWTNDYEKDPSYWMLSKIDGGIWIGFLTTNTEHVIRQMEKRAIELQSDEELRISDLYCRSNNRSPYPFETQDEILWSKKYFARNL